MNRNSQTYRKFFNRIAFLDKPAWLILMVISVLCLLAPLIANEKPYFVQYKGNTYYPIFDSNPPSILWDTVKVGKILWPPVRFGPDPVSGKKLLPPGSKNPVNGGVHILGTTEKKEDVLAGILYGGRRSLLVGMATTLLIGILGLFIGVIAGYWGDHKLKWSLMRWILLGIGIPLAWFYGIEIWKIPILRAAHEGLAPFFFRILMSMVLFVGIILGMIFLGKPFDRFAKKKYSLPIDMGIVWLIEMIHSLPTLLLIVTLTIILKERSLALVMLIIALTNWTGIALLVRGEMLREREMDYLLAAEGLGLPSWRIIIRHLIPNVKGPILAELTLVVGRVIIAESALSFLALIDEEMSWGRLINGARLYHEAWWLAVFPGLALFLTVISINLIGESYRAKWDRNK